MEKKLDENQERIHLLKDQEERLQDEQLESISGGEDPECTCDCIFYNNNTKEPGDDKPKPVETRPNDDLKATTDIEPKN